MFASLSCHSKFGLGYCSTGGGGFGSPAPATGGFGGFGAPAPSAFGGGGGGFGTFTRDVTART